MLRRTAFCLAVLLGGCDSKEAKSGDSNEAKAKATAKLPPVDAKAAKDAVATLPEIDPDQQALFAAMSIAELEKSRLPASLIEGLDALKSAPPDQHGMALAQTISDNIKLLDQACDSDGAELMTTLATANVDERHDTLWKTCKLERYGLVTAAETEGSEPIATIVAHMIYVHLAAGGPVSDDEKVLLTALAKMASSL